MLKKKKNSEATIEKTKTSPSTQSWMPVYDIKNNLVYRRDGVILAAVQVMPVNFNLLSMNEKRRRIKSLEEVLNGIDYDYQIFAIGKPVDLDRNINRLEKLKADTESIVKKNILSIYIRQAVAKALSGEALDQMFYFIIGNKLGKKPAQDEQVLLQKAITLSSNLNSADLHSNLCTDADLRLVNFVFNNPSHAAFERSPESNFQLPTLYSEEEVV